jgi:N-acetylglucosaminyldiphosphoundecaprenol N-acetyl-beta-D-mannosaminyltransferase
MNQTLAKIESFLASEKPHLVVTADATAIVIAHQDFAFQTLVEGADLVTPDGIGVLWAAKRQGVPLTQRVSGIDIVNQICRLSADKGYRLFLLGAATGVAELAAEKLRLKYPGCNIVGSRHGFFPAESDEVVAREIAETKPEILFVAMGMPRQEQFIRSTQHIIGAKVAMGVGGSFDVISGKTKRAPQLIQRMKLEWLWRLILNPKKISKVKMLPKFMVLILKEKP